MNHDFPVFFISLTKVRSFQIVSHVVVNSLRMGSVDWFSAIVEVWCRKERAWRAARFKRGMKRPMFFCSSYWSNPTTAHNKRQEWWQWEERCFYRSSYWSNPRPCRVSTKNAIGSKCKCHWDLSMWGAILLSLLVFKESRSERNVVEWCFYRRPDCDALGMIGRLGILVSILTRWVEFEIFFG